MVYIGLFIISSTLPHPFLASQNILNTLQVDTILKCILQKRKLSSSYVILFVPQFAHLWNGNNYIIMVIIISAKLIGVSQWFNTQINKGSA